MTFSPFVSRSLLDPGAAALAALFLIAATRRVGIRIVRQKVCLFRGPVFLFLVEADVGWAFLLDAARLMVIVADPVRQITFADGICLPA